VWEINLERSHEPDIIKQRDKSNNFCYRKVGRGITILESIEVQISFFGGTYTIFANSEMKIMWNKHLIILVHAIILLTVGENIIATIKMRNNCCYPLKMAIFQILREQYRTFLYCSPCSYRSSNFAIAKVVALCFNFCMIFVDWFMASFLYCFRNSYRSSNYCESTSCRSFTLLKALAKSNCNLFAIA
jgi:hypothetical protein